jgi:Arc/MetJ-type ribon-helix-helix transcriptional regulator
MHISLTRQSRHFIEEQVRSGRFTSPEQVLEEAVNRMMSDEGSELDDQTVEAINLAEAQIDRGEGIPFERFAVEARKRYGLKQ